MANPLSNLRGRVKFARRWTDGWQSFRGVYPLRCLRGCAPVEQNADIVYDYGDIKREDATDFVVDAPREFRDFYVRIELYDPDSSLVVPHWHGIVPRMTKTSQGGIVGTDTGRQIVQAVGLEHLLDRVQIADAYALQDGAAVKVEWIRPFNVKYRKGHRIKGNRSKNPGPDGVYIFDESADAEVWNARQIVEYLMRYFKPEGPQWSFTGQIDALTQIEEVYTYRGVRSLWDWLCSVIDRRRGLGFVIEPDLQESQIQLRIFTLTDVPITVGSRTLPANPLRTTFSAPSVFPDWHLVDPIKFTRTTAGVFDVIEARGERILGMVTTAYDDTKIELASTKAERDNYTKATEEERTLDRYDGVWSRFVFHHNWTYNVSNILGVSCNESLLFTCDDDGNVSPAGNGAAWQDATILERTLPLKRNVDYSVNPPKQLHDDKERPEFLPVQVFVKLPDDVPGAGGWRLADRLSEGQTQLPNCNVRTLDTRAGFEVSASPRHLWAAADWPKDDTGAFKNVEQIPRLDYKQVAATVAFRTDRRLKVVRKIDQSLFHETKRTLVIEVPGAEYWYALRGTVVDAAGGSLKRIHQQNRVLRDDSDILRGVAAFAQAWYQKERQSVVIPLKKIDNWVTLGTLLTEIGGQYNEPVNTVVSSAETDFRSGTIEYTTGWGEFDLMGGLLDEHRGVASRRANEVEYLGD